MPTEKRVLWIGGIFEKMIDHYLNRHNMILYIMKRDNTDIYYGEEEMIKKQLMILLAMSTSKGETYSPIQIQRIINKISRDLGDQVESLRFEFEPYNKKSSYMNVNDALKDLETDGFVESIPFKTWKNFRLSEKGQSLGEGFWSSLDQSFQERISGIVEDVLSSPFPEENRRERLRDLQEEHIVYFHKEEHKKVDRDIFLKNFGIDKEYRYLKVIIEDVDEGENALPPLFTYFKPSKYNVLVDKLICAIEIDEEFLRLIPSREMIPIDETGENRIIDATAWHYYSQKISGGRASGQSEEQIQLEDMIAKDWLTTKRYYDDNENERRITKKEFLESRVDKYPRLTLSKLNHYIRNHEKRHP